MFCVRCGASLPGGAAFCASCGAPVAGDAHAPGAGATRHYAGFWRRFWSHVLDRFILGVALTPVGLLVLAPLLAAGSSGWTDADLPEDVLAAVLGSVFSIVLLALTLTWLYYALLQSSSRQATLGQMALGLRTADLEGRRISFARASGRHFATLFTGLTFGIGYLIVLLTARRQTLHDLIAGTVVER